MNFNGLIDLVNNYIYVNPTLLRIIIAFLILLVGVLCRKIFVRWIINILRRFANKTKTNLDDLLITALERPAVIFIIGLSILLALNTLNMPVSIQPTIYRIFRTFFIVILFWFFYRASDSITVIFENFLNKSDKKISPVLINLFSKSLKVIIIVIEIFMVIKEWGFDVTGLITGLGIGGLAISLAAKDAASNLLGSITIMSDKTCDVGDWIQTNSVEGTVEEIGFRSTKIRTFANALTYVPNSIMSNEPITNWSKMGKRRSSFNLHIPLDTPADKITFLLSKIRKLLEDHDEVNQDFMAVNLSGFGEASLEILIYYFTKTTSYLIFRDVTEDINLRIKKIFEDIGIEIIAPRGIIIETKKPSK